MKQTLKFCIALAVIVIILIIVGILMICYEVEGDKNMPFNLSKIVVVSTAEGVENKGTNKWNFKIYQNNDLYLYIDKNNNYLGDSTYIEKVKIENINILDNAQVGEIKAYMPNSTEGRLYSYDSKYLIENKLEYRGAIKSNPQTLEIGNQGGSLLFRLSNNDIGQYSSNVDEQIVHDGTLLKKLNLTEEKLKFKVSFDIIIEAKKIQYKANVILNLPCEKLIDNGTSSLEITDMSDIVFKREN